MMISPEMPTEFGFFSSVFGFSSIGVGLSMGGSTGGFVEGGIGDSDGGDFGDVV